MHPSKYILVAITVTLFTGSSTRAGVPERLSIQGRLTNASASPIVGVHTVTFSAYDSPAGGTLLWSENQSVTTDAQGLFSVSLGAVSPIKWWYFNNVSAAYLGMKVEADPEMSPRLALTPSLYALRTGSLHETDGGLVYGQVTTGTCLGISGNSTPALWGIHELAGNGGDGNIGVRASARYSPSMNRGVYAVAYDANGSANSAAIYGQGISTIGGTIWAGYLVGWTNVTGNFYAAAKYFKIDDPSDPANRTLVHACVESDEFKNVYDGVVTTDAGGTATVTLPDWFDALNGDFRYQLTVIGQFAQAIVSSEIADRRFMIASDKPNVKVSWQVTGVRKDPYALAHPVEVQTLKAPELRGKYLHPVEYGVDEKLGVDYAAGLHAETPASLKAMSGPAPETDAVAKP